MRLPHERLDHPDERGRIGRWRAVTARQLRALGEWKVAGENLVDAPMECNGVGAGDHQYGSMKAS
jgi:hypothetical protein